MCELGHGIAEIASHPAKHSFLFSEPLGTALQWVFARDFLMKFIHSQPVLLWTQKLVDHPVPKTIEKIAIAQCCQTLEV
jgi:hypothetical protein